MKHPETDHASPATLRRRLLLIHRTPEQRQSGVSTIEVVLWTPIIVGFFMLIVTFGFLVNNYGDVQNAASDAARIGSLQRDYGDANLAAQTTAQTDLPTQCDKGPTVVPPPPATFVPGGLYTIHLVCKLDLSGFDWFNIGSETVTVTASAPLDQYRRTSP